MILADTSLWIDFLRGVRSPATEAFDERLSGRDVLVCGPVATELLSGCAAAERRRLWERLTALAWVDIDRAQWFAAGDLRAELREHGRQVSLPDALIAIAAAGRATLWTRDHHFEHIAGLLKTLDLRLLD